jgi:hypothetical protein
VAFRSKALKDEPLNYRCRTASGRGEEINQP